MNRSMTMTVLKLELKKILSNSIFLSFAFIGTSYLFNITCRSGRVPALVLSNISLGVIAVELLHIKDKCSQVNKQEIISLSIGNTSSGIQSNVNPNNKNIKITFSQKFVLFFHSKIF